MKDSNAEKQPVLADLFSEEFETCFKTNGKVYRRKIEPIRGAQQIAEATVVETRLPDGTLESTQEAKSGDWIITGSKGENFVFTDKKFQSLYNSNGTGGWVPKERKIVAISNPFGQSVRINAPWGGTQDGSEKAVLVAEIGPDGSMTKDRYIIGDEEMLLSNYEAE